MGLFNNFASSGLFLGTIIMNLLHHYQKYINQCWKFDERNVLGLIPSLIQDRRMLSPNSWCFPMSLMQPCICWGLLGLMQPCVSKRSKKRIIEQYAFTIPKNRCKNLHIRETDSDLLHCCFYRFFPFHTCLLRLLGLMIHPCLHYK